METKQQIIKDINNLLNKISKDKNVNVRGLINNVTNDLSKLKRTVLTELRFMIELGITDIIHPEQYK